MQVVDDERRKPGNIFDFISETAERYLLKLDRKQELMSSTKFFYVFSENFNDTIVAFGASFVFYHISYYV